MPQMNKPLDIFGQNPRLSRLYTQLCFCFSLDTSTADSYLSVFSTISRGLAGLAVKLPWTTGQVVQDEHGVFKIVAFKDSIELKVKDFSSELPSFAQYCEAAFPFTSLDESMVAPCRTLPNNSNQPAPVLSLQLNYVRGGLLLVVNAQHNCMDLRGQAQIIDLLSKICRNEPLSDDKIALANMPTVDHPLLGLSKGGRSTALPVTHMQPRSRDDKHPRAIWAYFDFSSGSLQELKEIASKDCSTEYISTDDALCAFVWQAVTRARAHRVHLRSLESTFERQVDARRHVHVAASYVGNVVCKVSVQMACKDLLVDSVGAVASRLREAISSKADIGDQTRKAAEQLRSTFTTPVQPSSRTTVPSTDIKMSSWAKEDCYNLDFGPPLGKPEAVRRPAFDAWEGLAYTMPKTLDGRIAVALCLRVADLEALRQDVMFTQHGTFIG